MSNTGAKANEKRFRRGTFVLFFISALSAASTAALYAGINIPIFYSTALAVPVVTDIALQTFFAGWIWMEKVRYYWFIVATALAAVLGGLALLAGFVSFSGHAFRQSFAGRSMSRLFGAFGVAQVLSSRALSMLGLLLYLLDVGVSVALVLASPQTFTPYYFFLLGNLLLHLITLTFLAYSFSAGVGGGQVSSNAGLEHDGVPRK